jgi:ribulose-phosphate 3-epimerase
MNFIIAPSILSANFLDVSNELKKIEKFPNSWVHLDIMDGSFVPVITFGSPFVKSIRKGSLNIFDVHLMVTAPEKQVPFFADAGANYITFHIESTNNPLDLIKVIKNLGIKAGLTLKPSTPISSIEAFLPNVDLVLVMSVEPGASGQKFIERALGRVNYIKKLKEKEHFNLLISVDGGINEKNAEEVIKAGADILVMGSYFFCNPFKDVENFIVSLRNKNTPLK